MRVFEDQIATTVAAHDFFAADRPICVARAPGRLDVMGGNVDYTGGLVLQSLLREAVWVAAQPRADDVVRILNPGAAQFGWECYFELHASDLRDPQSLRLLCEQREGTRWGCYVLGALYFLKRSYGEGCEGGVDLFILSDLPPNRGVSSSAALEIAALKALSTMWNVVQLDGVLLATAGQWVENVVAGSACGIMDQAAIVLGEQDHLLPLLCQPCLPSWPIKFPANMRIWGIDSMAPRSTTGVAYEAARAAAFIGYKLICQREGIDVIPEEGSEIPRWTDSRWQGYLSNLSPDEFRAKYERWLPESISGKEVLASSGEHFDPFTTIHSDVEYPVRAAVRYATEENLRVRRVRELLEASSSGLSDSSLQLVGEILGQSHRAYAECGLGSTACDELVERALRTGFPGAKMTGGGGGGVVAILGRPGDDHAVHRLAEEYGAQRNAQPYIFEGSSSGVDAFGVRTLELLPALEMRT
ncbi:galactokinase [Granulicella sp. WH15]|uniref:GHMP family kinase ATP-binding protein n=1 Tax=Granulicella sp. WH15 TaxID=2602070 RepID=UPI001367001A|nr:galactokinase family protein [Granulicella sp. WH15]QHN02897.1 galactokinase [Granulicella sp. WH15]